MLKTLVVLAAAAALVGCGGKDSIHKHGDHPASSGESTSGSDGEPAGGLPDGHGPGGEAADGHEAHGDGHDGHEAHEAHEAHGNGNEGHGNGNEGHGNGNEGHGDAQSPTAEQLIAAEKAAYESAKPVFEEYCAACHTPKKGRKKQKPAVKHFSMDGYPFGGHHAGELGTTIRKVLTGDKPTMPKDDPGTVQGAELELILTWADAYQAAHAAGAGDHKHHQSGHKH